MAFAGQGVEGSVGAGVEWVWTWQVQRPAAPAARAWEMQCELGISPSPAVAAAFGRFLRRLADTPVSTEGARLTRPTRPTTFSLTLLLPAVFLANAPAGG